jgi:hypothetical protein
MNRLLPAAGVPTLGPGIARFLLFITACATLALGPMPDAEAQGIGVAALSSMDGCKYVHAVSGTNKLLPPLFPHQVGFLCAGLPHAGHLRLA